MNFRSWLQESEYNRYGKSILQERDLQGQKEKVHKSIRQKAELRSQNTEACPEFIEGTTPRQTIYGIPLAELRNTNMLFRQIYTELKK